MKKTKKDNNYVSVFDEKVSCEGGEGDFGHPKIYLIIDSKTKLVECPYCGKQYKRC